MAKIVSDIAGSLLDSLGRSVQAFVELETADSKHVLSAQDGSLVTILSVGGVASLVGEAEFSSLVGKIADVLNTAVGRGGHILQLSFSRDPMESRRTVEESLDAAV